MKSSEQRKGLVGIIAVLLVVSLIVGALIVFRRPPGATPSDLSANLQCQGRPSFVMYNSDAVLYALAAVSQRDVWAVGAQGTRATVMRWGDRSSHDTDLPNLNTTTSALVAVAATGPKDVWAVGRADLQPLILHWDGVRWAQSSPVPIDGYSAVFSALVARDPADVWALGSVVQDQNSAPHTIAEHWDGAAWRAAPAPPGGTIIAATSGAGTSAPIIVATASGDAQQLTRWDGKVWQALATPAGVDLRAVAVGSDNTLWAGGSYWPQGANWAAPILERWDGLAWSKAEVGQYEARGAWLTSLAIGVDGSVWAAGMLRNPNTRLDNAFVTHVDSLGKAVGTNGGIYPARYTDPHKGDSFSVTAVAGMPGADGVWVIGTLGTPPDPAEPPIDVNLPQATGAFVLADC